MDFREEEAIEDARLPLLILAQAPETARLALGQDGVVVLGLVD